ncbi:MAG TPA: TonB-dependent receptor plug domain-containing protein [Longimicrobiales bacterium]
MRPNLIPGGVPAFLSFGALAAWILAISPSPLPAQQIRGTVLEAGVLVRVADAEIDVLDDHGSRILQLLSDSLGRFSAALPHGGTYSLRVAKIGYHTAHTNTFAVRNAEVIELRILIGTQAVPLTPLEVTARHGDVRAHPDFQRRVAWGRQTGSGWFFTRQEIERTGVLRISTMLMQVPSIRLVHARDGTVRLGVAERGAVNCRSAVYLNGVEVDQSAGLDVLTPEELEGVEVYRSRNEIPTELARGDVCAVVALWTRVGTPGPTWTWRRVLAVTAVIGGLTLYVLFR